MDVEKYIFQSDEEKVLAQGLMDFVLCGKKPVTTPALWQDVEKYIRFQKRDVWVMSDENISNALRAIQVYRLKYIVEHLTKVEILKILNELFSQEYDEYKKTLKELLAEKFMTDVDNLFLVQEKNIITKEKIKDFDKFFEYPGWIDFSDEARDIIFEKILNNKMTDEQIDYFLGASDDMKDYDKWYEVAKHVLLTTNNAHTFWVAGDVLNIIWIAAPEDEKSQKWFRDQIFEIFWSRIGSTWPMLNRLYINFNANDKLLITKDAIGWMDSLEDLKERIKELPEDYEVYEHPDDEEEFSARELYLCDYICECKNAQNSRTIDIVDYFIKMTELAKTKEHIARLRKLADEEVLPYIYKNYQSEVKENIHMINGALGSAENYVKSFLHERKVLEKYINKNMCGK